MNPTPTDESAFTPTDTGRDSPTEHFDHELERLLFASFAKGATVQGVRDVVSPSPAVPTWRISIEKVADGDAPDDAVFLDD